MAQRRSDDDTYGDRGVSTDRGPDAPGPGLLLADLRIVDLSMWQPGHYATQLLADLGAEVIKVEPPGGDRMRKLPDRFVNFNGRKRTVVLDLRSKPDLARLRDLVRDSDVVVEGYRPGVADRLGVGFESLRAENPSLVYCSISGYGQSGPLSAAPGHDWNYQAYAGAMSGYEPGVSPRPARMLVADHGGGMAAAFGILAAVHCARRTGVGEHVDVSMADLVASWVAPMEAVDPRRAATAPHIEAPAHGVFAVADGYIVLGIFSEDSMWNDLCRELGLESYVGLGLHQRTESAAELRAALAERLLGFSRDAVVSRLGTRLPVSPVLTREEMLDHPHFRARGTVVPQGPDGMRALGHPLRFAVHPALPPGPAPNLPERNDTA